MSTSTKDLIIQTASDLFYKQGYNLTGINEIIATAGIAKATLYSHFKSKEDLCIAYLASKDSALIAELQEFCEREPKGDDQLLAILKFLIPFFNSDDFNGCWCIRTIAEIPSNNEKIKHQIKNGKKALLDFINSLVQVNKPKLVKKQQVQLANRIYLLYEGAISESHLQGEAWPIHENIDMLEEQLQSKYNCSEQGGENREQR